MLFIESYSVISWDRKHEKVPDLKVRKKIRSSYPLFHLIVITIIYVKLLILYNNAITYYINTCIIHVCYMSLLYIIITYILQL